MCNHEFYAVCKQITHVFELLLALIGRIIGKILRSWGVASLQVDFFVLCHFVAHSPDNSFMGFIVEQHLNSSETRRSVKKDQAVVYGKAQHMWTVSYI